MITEAHFSAYCLAMPGATCDFPFDPVTPVYRVGGKIFAIHGAGDDPLRVNLKCDPDEALMWRDLYPRGVLPGYHMHKRHWNTVVCDGSVPDAEIWQMVDHSYRLVFDSLPRRVRQEPGGAG